MKDYCVHLTFFGRVQGVGFRFLVLKKANSFGIKGWVKNSSDFDLVEAVFFGEEKKIKELISELKHPAYWVRVDNVVVEEIKSSEKFVNFEIRY
jgi:acylphosphatase